MPEKALVLEETVRDLLRRLPVVNMDLPDFEPGGSPADPVTLFSEWFAAAIAAGRSLSRTRCRWPRPTLTAALPAGCWSARTWSPAAAGFSLRAVPAPRVASWLPSRTRHSASTRPLQGRQYPHPRRGHARQRRGAAPPTSSPAQPVPAPRRWQAASPTFSPTLPTSRPPSLRPRNAWRPTRASSRPPGRCTGCWPTRSKFLAVRPGPSAHPAALPPQQSRMDPGTTVVVSRPQEVSLSGKENLLTLGGRLSAVIDFGRLAIGDPTLLTFWSSRSRAASSPDLVRGSCLTWRSGA